MASKRELIKKLQMELWVMDRIGILKTQTLHSRSVQKKKLTCGCLTIGEARMILREFGAKPVVYRGSTIVP